MVKACVYGSERLSRLNRIADIGCIVCRECLGIHDTPAEIHHIRDGQGMSQRAGDDECIPLCYHHHRGCVGIHTLGTKVWQETYKPERELLRIIREELGEDKSEHTE